mmetsp:Transcript_14635/g.29259  ORF Transcript_14635/g.29259 Transcript_14635/m.29259 type:complete len:135 (+) Transcript_14635:243-647(+)
MPKMSRTNISSIETLRDMSRLRQRKKCLKCATWLSVRYIAISFFILEGSYALPTSSSKRPKRLFVDRETTYGIIKMQPKRNDMITPTNRNNSSKQPDIRGVSHTFLVTTEERILKQGIQDGKKKNVGRPLFLQR